MTERKVITRGEWGARYAPSGYTRRVGALDKWLHHSVTVAPDLVPPFADDYAAIRSIESITEQRFGIGMAYTFLITPAGLVFEGHPVNQIGAHTAGYNTVSAGICLVGNYEKTAPSTAALESLTWLLHHGQDRNWWQRANLQGGHRDTKPTACPGAKAYDLIDNVNRGEYLDKDGPDFVNNPIKPPKPATDKITVDGYWGTGMTRRMQKVLGTTQDGIVSSQEAEYRRRNRGLTSGWRWVQDPKGSLLIAEHQEILRKRGFYKGKKDGIAGPGYFSAIQQDMGTSVDGFLQPGSPAIVALQKRLNNGKV